MHRVAVQNQRRKICVRRKILGDQQQIQKSTVTPRSCLEVSHEHRELFRVPGAVSVMYAVLHPGTGSIVLESKFLAPALSQDRQPSSSLSC